MSGEEFILGAMRAARQRDFTKLGNFFYGYVAQMQTYSLDDVAEAAYYFGTAFEMVGDLEAAKNSYRQCLQILGGTGHLDCKERFARLTRKHEGGQRPDRNSDDPFAVLGVPHGASDDEIKRAFRALMKQHHPDRVAALGSALTAVAEAKTKRLTAAYDELKRHRKSAA